MARSSTEIEVSYEGIIDSLSVTKVRQDTITTAKQEEVEKEMRFGSNRFLSWVNIVRSFIDRNIDARLTDSEIIEKYRAYIEDLKEYIVELQEKSTEVEEQKDLVKALSTNIQILEEDNKRLVDSNNMMKRELESAHRAFSTGSSIESYQKPRTIKQPVQQKMDDYEEDQTEPDEAWANGEQEEEQSVIEGDDEEIDDVDEEAEQEEPEEYGEEEKTAPPPQKRINNVEEEPEDEEDPVEDVDEEDDSDDVAGQERKPRTIIKAYLTQSQLSRLHEQVTVEYKMAKNDAFKIRSFHPEFSDYSTVEHRFYKLASEIFNIPNYKVDIRRLDSLCRVCKKRIVRKHTTCSDVCRSVKRRFETWIKKDENIYLLTSDPDLKIPDFRMKRKKDMRDRVSKR